MKGLGHLGHALPFSSALPQPPVLTGNARGRKMEGIWGERIWGCPRSVFWLGLLVGRLEVLYRAACQHHAEDARDVT